MKPPITVPPDPSIPPAPSEGSTWSSKRIDRASRFEDNEKRNHAREHGGAEKSISCSTSSSDLTAESSEPFPTDEETFLKGFSKIIGSNNDLQPNVTRNEACNKNRKTTCEADEEGSATGMPSLQRLPVVAAKTALLVVDVQPQYWSECPAIRKDFPHFPESLSKTIATCRARGAKIVFVRADYRHSHSPWLKQFARLHANNRSSNVMTEVPCDPESDGFRWEDFATPQGGDVVLPKTSWSSTSNPKLMKWLRATGIDTVLVCGLITSICVQHSAFAIFEAGFRTLLVSDACGDRGRERHDAALALYGNYMYEVVTSDELVNETHWMRKADNDPDDHSEQAEPLWLSHNDVTRKLEVLETRWWSRWPLASYHKQDAVQNMMEKIGASILLSWFNFQSVHHRFLDRSATTPKTTNCAAAGPSS